MQLTPSIVDQAPRFISATKDLTLSLRNKNLTSIHNLEVPDIYTILDLTSNSLVELPTKLPKKLNRLKMVLLANNLLISLPDESAQIWNSWPNVEYITLSNNQINSVQSLNGLKALKNLKGIYITNNPIKEIEIKGEKWFKLWCVKHLALDVVNWSRVTKADISESNSIEEFNLLENKKDSDTDKDSANLMGNSSVDTDKGKYLSDSQRKELETQLLNATSLEEISRIESILGGSV